MSKKESILDARHFLYEDAHPAVKVGKIIVRCTKSWDYHTVGGSYIIADPDYVQPTIEEIVNVT